MVQLINNLEARVCSYHSRLESAVRRVLDSGWLILGPEVERFERQFAEYVGLAHCVGVANGTDAIELGLRGIGANPGDRVATVANAGMYATTAILAIGAEPLFMDVAGDSGCATADEVARAIEAGARAVVVTHLYGVVAPEIDVIAELCRARGVRLLEDCAQCHGGTLDGRCAGTFGDAASFSFYPTKNLGALGDGGAVLTADTDVARRVRQLRQYGWSRKYEVAMSGGRNSRLDEMQAAVLSVFLPDLEQANERRRAIARRYAARIVHGGLELPATRGAGDVAHLYVVRSAQRDALARHLKQCGIATDIHYPIPDHRQPMFGTRFGDVHLPVTERLASEILTIPCYPEMTDEAVDRVADSINAWACPA